MHNINIDFHMRIATLNFVPLRVYIGTTKRDRSYAPSPLLRFAKQLNRACHAMVQQIYGRKSSINGTHSPTKSTLTLPGRHNGHGERYIPYALSPPPPRTHPRPYPFHWLSADPSISFVFIKAETRKDRRTAKDRSCRSDASAVRRGGEEEGEEERAGC